MDVNNLRILANDFVEIDDVSITPFSGSFFYATT